MKTTVSIGILLAAVLAFAVSAHSQGYPSKAIKLIIPNPPGGGTDLLGRFIAEKLHAELGQPVIVENRAGANGNVAAEFVSRAASDGHTVFFTHPVPLVINKALFAKLTYDPDLFVPISLIAKVPYVLIVNPKAAANNVEQLIALAKANPDRLNFASSGANGTSHLTAELFNSMAGIRVVGVPYQGTGPAAAAVLSGQVEMMFVELSTALPQVRAGKVRVLAVASEKRSPFLPNVRSMSEVLPGFVASTWYGAVAPPGTPAVIADRISAVIAGALKQPDVTKRLLDMSFEAVGSTPAELGQFMKEERKRWGDVIRVSGAKAD